MQCSVVTHLANLYIILSVTLQVHTFGWLFVSHQFHRCHFIPSTCVVHLIWPRATDPRQLRKSNSCAHWNGQEGVVWPKQSWSGQAKDTKWKICRQGTTNAANYSWPLLFSFHTTSTGIQYIPCQCSRHAIQGNSHKIRVSWLASQFDFSTKVKSDLSTWLLWSYYRRGTLYVLHAGGQIF